MKRRFSLSVFAVAVSLAAVAGWGGGFPGRAIAQQVEQPGPAAGGDLGARVAQLEERIRELQGVIATLQTFIGSGAAASSPGALPGGADPAAGGNGGAPSEISIRVLALETQIRALTERMQQLGEQLGQPGAGGDAAAQPQPWQQGRDTTGQPETHPWRQGRDTAREAGPRQARPAETPYPSAAPEPRTTSGGAQFATTSPSFGTAVEAGPQASPPPGRTALLPAVPGGSAGGGAREVYDHSYELFLRNDLDAAESGFRSFVETYPDDPLASNAWYWLGRSHFERKQFEPAAKAFLAGYKQDKKSDLAPDNLLHLGISLAQLGEKDAACSTLGAIAKQFPQAPDKLKQDAATAQKRARC